MVTLKTLNEASAQQVFDQVVTHLLTQNKQSRNTSGMCMYRNAEGLKCAVGCLIAEDEYKPAMEGKLWCILVETSFVPHIHKILIMDLQFIHDVYSPVDWAKELQLYAQSSYLVYREV